MSSILFILCSLSFVGLLAVLIQSKTENIVEAFVIGAAYLFVAVGIVGAVYEMLHVPVFLFSICVGIGTFDAIFANIILSKRKQFVVIHKFEGRYLLSVIILTAFVLFMCLYHFGFNLKLTYGDVDAVRYFTSAMSIVKSHAVTGEFVTPLWISIFIQLIQPIQSEVFLYRGMILGNICMQILIVIFFFVLANKVNKNRNFINAVLAILFWCGYQLYILSYGTFLHWQDGILLIMFIQYHIMLIWEKKNNLRYGVISCLMGTFVLACCYPFFGIILIVLVMPEVIVWLCKVEDRKYIPKWEKIVFFAVMVVSVIVGSIFMKERIPDLRVLFYNFLLEGLAYKEPYMDFLFLIPILILYFFLMVKKQYTNNMVRTIFRMNIAAVLFIICWFLFYEKGYLSNYYLYRNYYVLWLLAWLATAQTVGLLLYEKQALLVRMYSILYGLCIMISVIGLDGRIYDYNPDLYLENPADRTMTPLYSFNFDNWSKRGRSILSSDMYNMFQYRIDNLKDDSVLMISSQWKVLESQWFEGICKLAKENKVVSIEDTSFVQIIENLETYQCGYVLIDKMDPILRSYLSIMNKYWTIEVETEEAVIYRQPKNGWQAVLAGLEKSEISVEFEDYVRKNYGYNNVMLLCEGDYGGQGNIDGYRAYVGEETLKYVGQFEPGTFVECTYVFNNDDVTYLSIYKDSELYLQNQQYFDAQKILFESDLAMIITYNGSGWMPSQQ